MEVRQFLRLPRYTSGLDTVHWIDNALRQLEQFLNTDTVAYSSELLFDIEAVGTMDSGNVDFTFPVRIRANADGDPCAILFHNGTKLTWVNSAPAAGEWTITDTVGEETFVTVGTPPGSGDTLTLGVVHAY